MHTGLIKYIRTCGLLIKNNGVILTNVIGKDEVIFSGQKSDAYVCMCVCLPQTKHAATRLICQVCLPRQRVSQTAMWREQCQAGQPGSQDPDRSLERAHLQAPKENLIKLNLILFKGFSLSSDTVIN